jgi:hypothetical protein
MLVLAILAGGTKCSKLAAKLRLGWNHAGDSAVVGVYATGALSLGARCIEPFETCGISGPSKIDDLARRIAAIEADDLARRIAAIEAHLGFESIESVEPGLTPADLPAAV